MSLPGVFTRLLAVSPVLASCSPLTQTTNVSQRHAVFRKLRRLLDPVQAEPTRVAASEEKSGMIAGELYDVTRKAKSKRKRGNTSAAVGAYPLQNAEKGRPRSYFMDNGTTLLARKGPRLGC